MLAKVTAVVWVGQVAGILELPGADDADWKLELSREGQGLFKFTAGQAIFSLVVFVSLYASLGVVDFVLMRRYARLDLPDLDDGADAGAGAGAAAVGY